MRYPVIGVIFLVLVWLPKRPNFGRNRNLKGSPCLLSIYSLTRSVQLSEQIQGNQKHQEKLINIPNSRKHFLKLNILFYFKMYLALLHTCICFGSVWGRHIAQVYMLLTLYVFLRREDQKTQCQ